MWLSWRTGTLLLVLSVIPLGCSGNSEQARQQEPAAEQAPVADSPSPREVVIDHFSYDPPTLTVPAGTRVTWVNRDDVPHTVTSASKPRALESLALDTDERFSHVFTVPGTYEYFCAVHPKMTARVVVK
jgi:plastocyanin